MSSLMELNSKQYLGRKQIVLDCKFSVESGKEIEKILSVNAVPYLADIDILIHKANFKVKAGLEVMYLGENQSKQSFTTIADASDVIENDLINPNCQVEVEFKVVDVTTPSIKSNEVKIACILDLSFYLNSKTTVEIVEELEDCCYKKDILEVVDIKSTFNENVDLNEEFKIEGDLSKIVAVQVSSSVKNSFAGNGYIVVSGVGFANILYEDEIGCLKNYKTSFEIKQEISANDISKDDIIKANLTVLNYLAKVTVIQADGYNIIKWETSGRITGTIYESKLIDKVCDAYSLKDNIECKTQKCKKLDSIFVSTFEDSIKGEISFNEDENSHIVGFIGENVAVSNSVIENDKLRIEGVVSATVLYENENGCNSVIAEVPFETSFAKGELIGLDNIILNTSILDLDVDKRSNTIELISKINFNLCAYKNAETEIISGVEIVGKREKPDCAIEMIIVGENQSIWDLCKKIGVSEENLLKQNPELIEPLSEGQKILLFHSVE